MYKRRFPVAMHIDVNALRQQAWRAEIVYRKFIAYAHSIGCSVMHDEIVSDDEQARLLANWWMDNA